MKKITYLLACLLITLTTGCNDWLDVRPNTEQKDEDLFSNAQGFYDALIGCYMTMADRNIYGEQLSMTYIESLANLWNLPNEQTETDRLSDWAFTQHDYTLSFAENSIQTIYATLFNTIAQANMIIKNIELNGDVILDSDIRSVIEGEAYAIRAYCQLDVLRLFGQVPNGNKTISLPYSETTSIDEVPAYYDFDSYVAKLNSDISMAESLLLDKDPVFKYSFDDLNSGSSAPVDEFMLYRQFRMNYWAVQALKARLLLYIGQKNEAYNAAMEIINAQLNGKPVMSLATTEDFMNGYKLCPSECLFGLSKYNVKTYSETFLIGGNSNIQYDPRQYLTITETMLSNLYAGIDINSQNRYRYWWGRIQDSSGNTQRTILKYYWDESSVDNASLKFAFIPMLRMSEVYLIAIECAPSLSETNSLFKTYMLAHDIPDEPDFESTSEINEFIVNEYRREFFAEGQMFYTYKRLNSPTILWYNNNITEDTYILPLPRTEYNSTN